MSLRPPCSVTRCHCWRAVTVPVLSGIGTAICQRRVAPAFPNSTATLVLSSHPHEYYTIYHCRCNKVAVVPPRLCHRNVFFFCDLRANMSLWPGVSPVTLGMCRYVLRISFNTNRCKVIQRRGNYFLGMGRGMAQLNFFWSGLVNWTCTYSYVILPIYYVLLHP